jgi:hypothetical protein
MAVPSPYQRNRPIGESHPAGVLVVDRAYCTVTLIDAVATRVLPEKAVAVNV